VPGTAPPGRQIAAGAFVIALGNIASRLLGMVRDPATAAVLGYEASASAFRTAARVPTMVYDLLIGGAISAALIPVFSGYAEREGRAELWRLVNAVLTWVVLIIVPIIAVAVFLLIHILPEKIAERKKHPQAKAIQCLCLLSLVFGGLLWPLAWIWAFNLLILALATLVLRRGGTGRALEEA